jgi:hypothetical protein
LTSTEHKELYEQFADDIRDLEQMLGRDLSISPPNHSAI